MASSSRGDPWPSEAWPASQPPPYSTFAENAPGPGNLQKKPTLLYADPRQSSAQSLSPSSLGDHDADGNRRRLLIIYIHGFYGNDQSFRSFPAHVHGYLKDALYDTHSVHSKIYPRYKTYKAIDIAVENFSAWLKPHEDPETDVVLVGHSMGGILAAEVALLQNKSPYNTHPFRHRILGTIAMDCPFLGLHPGIVVAGISSLFRSGDEPPPPPALGESSSSAMLTPTTSVTGSQLTQADSNSSYQIGQSPFMSPSTMSLSSQTSTPNVDPYFNAPFFNDAEFKERPFKQRLVRFVKKHSSEGIFGAAKSHILSHLEYGSCLADYPALHSRYNRIRALEDVDDLQTIRKQQPNGAGPPLARVRFVNYFTISTGRPKKEKPTTPPADDTHTPPTERSSLENDQLAAPGSDELDRTSRSSTPAIQVDPPADADKKTVVPAHGTTEANEPSSEQKATSSTDALGHFAEESQTSLGQVSSIQEEAKLPAIPEAPPKPTPPDLSRYPDDDSRRQAEKEAKRELKAYEQAVKNREKAVQERQKLLEKRRKKSEKERAKLDKEAEKQRAKDEKEKEKHRQKETPEPATTEQQHQQQPPALPPRASSPADFDSPQTPNTDHHDLVPDHEAPALRSISPIPESDTEMPPIQAEAERVEASKPLKERKFCVVPRRNDPAWVSVFMRDMDEVGAHCGLFIAEAPHYDGLVGDFGQRIVGWVHEDMSKKAILRLAEETDDLGLD
ncbi:hypothetical protein F5X68DRAFT_15465 [Plectosphaerella plurivora]|uniref:AB hydrolase-1 domain-containing protein n=1 Tax=Plectosphaerella plurivora TaxID=936078 RepID=A0A9P8VC31_9PEZI|nr:hypothetical protein F5X68DRAFT_15465 [Plectosphaerella plurivora]